MNTEIQTDDDKAKSCSTQNRLTIQCTKTTYMLVRGRSGPNDTSQLALNIDKNAIAKTCRPHYFTS